MSALLRIFESKRNEVEESQRKVSLDSLKAICRDVPAAKGFRNSLESATGVGLIAEVKKASPSRGVIREEFDPVEIALDYEQAGANAISVLTDRKYFQGGLDDLKAVRRSVDLPLLRKDFIFDPYQVYEARANGADAILLIVAELDRTQLDDLRSLAADLSMDCLVEVHNEKEMELALAARCDLVGVNNRDLATFTTDLAVSERLIPLIAPYALAVAESGIETKSGIDRMEAACAKAVLIGTVFCASPDVRSKVKEVMGK